MKTYIKKNSVNIIVIMYNYHSTFILPQVDLLKKARTNTLILQLVYHRAKYPSQSCVAETQCIQVSCITLFLIYNYFS